MKAQVDLLPIGSWAISITPETEQEKKLIMSMNSDNFRISIQGALLGILPKRLEAAE